VYACTRASPVYACTRASPVYACTRASPVYACTRASPVYACTRASPVYACTRASPVYACTRASPVYACTRASPVYACTRAHSPERVPCCLRRERFQGYCMFAICTLRYYSIQYEKYAMESFQGCILQICILQYTICILQYTNFSILQYCNMQYNEVDITLGSRGARQDALVCTCVREIEREREGLRDSVSPFLVCPCVHVRKGPTHHPVHKRTRTQTHTRCLHRCAGDVTSWARACTRSQAHAQHIRSTQDT
jgi:hypothetical protein